MINEELAPDHVPSAELDRRRWSFTSPRYRVVDLDFGIRSDDAATASFLALLLEPFVVPGEPPCWYSILDLGSHRSYRFGVYLGSRRVLAPPDADLLVRLFLWYLNQRVMDETRSFAVAHAGVVSLAGQAVVIPGRANAGKSTLVAALVVSGFDYLSDEAALFDPRTGHVAPYPRALSVEAGSLPLLPWLQPGSHPGYDARAQWFVPAGRLPGRVRRDPCPAAAVVFPSVRPGGDTRLIPLSRGTAVKRLAEEATNLDKVGVFGFRALVSAVRGATNWELELDGVAIATQLIRGLLDARD